MRKVIFQRSYVQFEIKDLLFVGVVQQTLVVHITRIVH